MKQYIIDAFTDTIAKGNPAAVCILDKWLEEDSMKEIARINGLSETAFIVKEGSSYRLRWFTPACEVGLCGHATLASGFVILNYYDSSAREVTFLTQAGELKVARHESMYQMLFPNIPLSEVEVTKEMVDALGIMPEEAWMGKDLDLVVVLPSANDVKSFSVNPDALMTLPGRMVHITAPGENGYDCCSRCFGPKIGIVEDPVCGSAHCQIAPYWAKRLSKKVINAWEASERGGELQAEILNEEQILLRGTAVLESVSQQ